MTGNELTDKDILPVTRSKADAQASYNRLSKIYDVLVAAGERRYREAGLTLLDIKAGDCVIEIGSGTGLSLVEFAKRTGDDGFVMGLDLSTGMLKVTGDRLSEADLGKKVSLCCGDAAYLPVKDGAFDAAFMSFTLELFDTPEIPVVLQEIRRILSPGGRLCIVSLSRAGKRGLMTNLYEWGHRRFPKLLDCRPIYLANALTTAGCKLLKELEMSYWGLRVSVVLAVI